VIGFFNCQLHPGNLFVIVLLVIALLINSCQEFGTGQRLASAPVSVQTVPQQPQQQPDTGAAAARQAAQDAAAEHATYLARYLNTGFPRTPGVKAIAVAVMSEDGALNRAVTVALVNRIKRQSLFADHDAHKPESQTEHLGCLEHRHGQ
jgi:hypothetical protein